MRIFEKNVATLFVKEEIGIKFHDKLWPPTTSGKVVSFFFQSVSKKGIVTLKRGLLLLETINSLFA